MHSSSCSQCGTAARRWRPMGGFAGDIVRVRSLVAVLMLLVLCGNGGEAQRPKLNDFKLSNFPPGLNFNPYFYTRRASTLKTPGQQDAGLKDPRQAQSGLKRAPNGGYFSPSVQMEEAGPTRVLPDYVDLLPKTKIFRFRNQSIPADALDEHASMVTETLRRQAIESRHKQEKRRVGESPETCAYYGAPLSKRQLCCFYGGQHHCLPNVVIIGAQKTGTTALYAYLLKHPNFVPAKTKEVHFFDISPRYNRGFREYLREFLGHDTAAAAEQSITGEASPSYMSQEGVCRRIREVVPHAKLIAIVRDPVKRVWSEIQMLKRQVERSGDEAEMQARAGISLRKCLEDSSFGSKPRFNSTEREIRLNRAHVAKEVTECMPADAVNSTIWDLWIDRVVSKRHVSNSWDEGWAGLRQMTADGDQWTTAWSELLASVDPGIARADERTTDPAKLVEFLRREAQFIELCERKHNKNFLICNYNPMASDISKDFLWRSLYAHQLEECYKWFPRSNIMVIEQEELSKATQETLTRVQEFVGLPQHDFSGTTSEEAMAEFNRAYPDFEVSTGWGKKSAYEPIPDAVRDFLIDYFEPYNAKLFELLGRNFTHWQKKGPTVNADDTAREFSDHEFFIDAFNPTDAGQ